MDKPRIRRKSTSAKRFLVPAILILILVAIITVFAITILSVAGLTPGM